MISSGSKHCSNTDGCPKVSLKVVLRKHAGFQHGPTFPHNSCIWALKLFSLKKFSGVVNSAANDQKTGSSRPSRLYDPYAVSKPEDNPDFDDLVLDEDLYKELGISKEEIEQQRDGK
jgi:hypothetical protein